MDSTRDPGVRRLVNAVLVPGFVGPKVPEWLAAELQDGLGGVCWFAHNVSDQPSAKGLADSIHEANAKALIWCDEEGGAVSRLHAGTGSPWPGHAALGQLDDLDATRTVGAGIGTDARATGIDLALAPVVDVNSEPDNPVIGVRSFGDDPALVSRHAKAFIDGLQGAGIAACAKHFPGHGATHVDSHLGLPTVDADSRLLRDRELVPFAAAVEAGVRAVLTAHVVFPAVDTQPATMSAEWMRLLRDEIGFEGVIGTDALDMRAISDGVGRAQGAVAGLRAGVDAVCIGNPDFPDEYDEAVVFGDVRTAVLDAIDGGTLSVGRVEEAAGRLDELAQWVRGQAAGNPVPEAVGLDIGRRTVRTQGMVRVDGDVLVLVQQSGNLAAGDTRLPLAAMLRGRFPATVSLEAYSAADVASAIEDHPGLVPVVVTDGLDGMDVVDAARAAAADVVVVHTGPVGSATDLAAPLIRTWGGGASTARAVMDLLTGGVR